MTKAQLIKQVAERVDGLTKRQTEIIIHTMFEGIKDALATGHKIEIRGFGSFRIRHRRMREGRNPRSGVTVLVPPKKIPFFKTGKALKELVDTSV